MKRPKLLQYNKWNIFREEGELSDSLQSKPAYAWKVKQILVKCDQDTFSNEDTLVFLSILVPSIIVEEVTLIVNTEKCKTY